MAISQGAHIRLTKYLLLAGICITFPAFVVQPENQTLKTAHNPELMRYFDAPQLPERFCNLEPKKKSKPGKRIKTKAKSKPILIPLAMNPVLGATRKSIISFFGDARNGGRKHEGIDILAPKGTMVVAPAEGTITEVGYNSLGGKVIWMKDRKQKRSYYFAHLDSQVVSEGMIVKPGDTLGTVGNTGNARHTKAHLHFGIYKKDGRTPVDYMRTREQVISMLASK